MTDDESQDQTTRDRLRLESRAALNHVYSLVKFGQECNDTDRAVFHLIWEKLYKANGII